ncbi:ATP-binding protein [uncultured Pontibacter sp.]|uniref:sensor histidine kinase n=1 Tax=uncultured Pontibacter sp. TaxID=453356 RepID=UPI002611DE94|nr:ATP-binding protein [uncultured Pontibacter sp.]
MQSIQDRVEQARLKALYSFQIIDTEAERDFDDITELASVICDTPISLITLLTHNRQWFKSRKGIDVTETPRSISFCHHAIKQENVYEVTDAHQDEIFRENPLVTGDPNIRFYAGAPLITESGHRLGTLCVIDTVAKKLTDAQKKALKTLSKQVMVQFELRQKQKQLEKEKKFLEEANEKLDRFTHMVSHDLKEPVHNISAIVEWVEEDLTAGNFGLISEHAALLKERAEAMDALISGLLEYAGMQIQNLNKEEVAVGELLQSIKSGLRGAAGFEITISPDMPVIKTEKVLLNQVFSNLLSNAIKYHQTGQGKIDVSASVTSKGSYLFCVKDDGPGIPADCQQKIFGLFERLARDSKKEGSGIGLATVRKIVEERGGKIWVESELGKGAAFYFTWPV